MPQTKHPLTHEAVLQKISAEIDVSPEIYETVVSRYKSLGDWLERPHSTLKKYDPLVAPQGSFLIGTANKPVHENDEIDVDLICRLNATKRQLSQKQLKDAVGIEVVTYAKTHDMTNDPEDKRRCWTLEYADQRNFHIDILPCIPDAETYRSQLNKRGYASLASNARITEQAIAITDKTLEHYDRLSSDWPTSNPLGYAAWFKEQMAERIQFAKRSLFQEGTAFAKVEDIPDHAVKTTLQKTIQLLKRHRDTMFANDQDHKPISIIITTLAARSYGNEPTLVEALTSILNGMDDHIEEIDGVKWVSNPVNPDENFADKWADVPTKEKNFFNWLNAARREFGVYLRASKSTNIPNELTERMGVSVIAKVSESFPKPEPTASTLIAAPAIVTRTNEMANRVKERQTESAPWCAER